MENDIIILILYNLYKMQLKIYIKLKYFLLL